MSFEITGKVIEVYPVNTISEKFKKREFVIEVSDNRGNFDFKEYVKFQLTQDKCSLADMFKKDEIIKVSFNLRGRKWEKDGVTSYFTNLEAWKIEKMIQNAEITATVDPSFPVPSDFPAPAEESDDLPF